MANLFVCSDYFISNVQQDATVAAATGGHLDSDGHWTEDFSYHFQNDQLYDQGTQGEVTQFNFLTGNTRLADGTYTNVGQESSTGDGTGLVVTITADAEDPYTCTLVNGGAGHKNMDLIYFSNTDIGQNTAWDRPRVQVLEVNNISSNLFPVGISEAAILANAIPLINTIISSGSG
jgi:hypothetical protein